MVDIGHENFTVGIIHRGKTVNGVSRFAAPRTRQPRGRRRRRQGGGSDRRLRAGARWRRLRLGTLAGGITHDSQTEGYYIVSGGGTMFTDGYIVNGRHSPLAGPERADMRRNGV